MHMQKHNNDTLALIRLSEIVSLAEFLSVDTISVRNTEPIYPVTVGEKIACYALDIVLLHEWSSDETEQAVAPLEEALQQLDTGVDKPAVWNDLFIANSALKAYLQSKPQK